MEKTDVMVIGAGAAGLMAAYTLIKEGKTVCILEARDRIGGRIHTVAEAAGAGHIELGAEFIHGNLPVTLSLLQEAGIGYENAHFEMWRYRGGTLAKNDEPIDGWEALMEQLEQLVQDIPMSDFLQQFFGAEKHAALRAQVEAYVNGYDTACLSNVSALALRHEWSNEDDGAQYRVEGGYTTLINYLAKVCLDNGARIFMNQAVTEVSWEEDRVAVQTKDGSVYQSSRLITALPLGVLQTPGAVVFRPSLPEQAGAIENIGFGSVLKMLLEFDHPFWNSPGCFGAPSKSPVTRFVTSGEEVPTFWTQSDKGNATLTGWLGGPAARSLKDKPAESILQAALESLGRIFHLDPGTLKTGLVAWRIADWNSDPYTRGSYAYDKVGSGDARKILQRSVAQTLYFAGEYLYEGAAMGTVEAALTSGKEAAASVLFNGA